MKLLFITLLFMILVSCNQNNKIASKAEKTKLTPSHRTTFLIDHCDINLLVELEEDITKGNDSCVLRIRTLDKKMIKIETLNVPVDRSSITNCEKDYVIVESSCGGPCYSKLFVFTDNRKNKQFDYCQNVSNNTNIIAHIKNEEFERLIIHNLKNGKEQIVQNPDINWMQYGQMDKMYIAGNTLKLEYQTVNKQTKKKSISLNDILK